MHSHWSQRTVGDEPSGAYPPHGWSTSYPDHSASNQPSPGRREHARQPPPLTTAFSGQHLQGLGVQYGGNYASTPLSTTSLSSPFVQGQSPAVNTPGGVALGTSPMASRQYNVPYNPQDWGPMNGGVMHAGQPSYAQPNNNMLRVMTHSRPAGPHTGLSRFFSCLPFSVLLP